MTSPDNSSPSTGQTNASVESPPPRATRTTFEGCGVLLARILGLLLIVGSVIAIRTLVRGNRGEAAPILILLAVGLIVLLGAAKVVQVLGADVRREKPSRRIGVAKLVLGVCLAWWSIVGLRDEGAQFVGLLSAAHFGWIQSFPYAAIAAVGGLGIVVGALALAGRRPGWHFSLGLFCVFVTGLSFVPSTLSQIRHVARIASVAELTEIACSPDGRFVAVAMPSRILVYQISPFEKISEFQCSPNKYHVLALSNDGERLADMPQDPPQGLTIWKSQIAAPVVTVDMQETAAFSKSLSFSDDGTKLLQVKMTTPDDDSKWKVTMFDAMTGQILNQFPVPTQSDAIPVISPDGQYVAASLTGSQASNFGKVAVWSVSTANLHTEIEIPDGVPVAWSPNSSRLLVTTNGELIQFELETRQALWTASFPEEMYSAELTNWIVRGDDRRILAVCDQAKGRWLQGDFRQILAAPHQDNAWVIDADDGQPLAQYSRFPEWAVHWTATGHWIVTCDRTGQVDLWDASRLGD